MQGKNHVALALAGALLIGPPGADVAAWAGLVIGSLAPDLDGGGQIAYAGTMFMPRVVPYPIRKLVDVLGVGISSIVRKIFGHRGALHYPVWGVLLWLAGWHWGLPWLAWFGFGYVAHIAGDALTKSGVPLLGPLVKTDIAFSPMKTGGALETLFGLGLWVFVAWRLWPMLLAIAQPEYVLSLVKKFSVLF